MTTFEDDTLAELVRKYKVQYDKTHPEFHRKDTKKTHGKKLLKH